jgi:hypothetical protein
MGSFAQAELHAQDVHGSDERSMWVSFSELSTCLWSSLHAGGSSHCTLSTPITVNTRPVLHTSLHTARLVPSMRAPCICLYTPGVPTKLHHDNLEGSASAHSKLIGGTHAGVRARPHNHCSHVAACAHSHSTRAHSCSQCAHSTPWMCAHSAMPHRVYTRSF